MYRQILRSIAAGAFCLVQRGRGQGIGDQRGGEQAAARLLEDRLFGILLEVIGVEQEQKSDRCDREQRRDPAARLLYCMPSVHNPTTATLAEARRVAIARIAAERGIIVIEDDVNPREEGATVSSFAEIYPERSVYISSLSKTVAPGLRIAYLLVPPDCFEGAAAGIRATVFLVAPLMAAIMGLGLGMIQADAKLLGLAGSATLRPALVQPHLVGLTIPIPDKGIEVAIAIQVAQRHGMAI